MIEKYRKQFEELEKEAREVEESMHYVDGLFFSGNYIDNEKFDIWKTKVATFFSTVFKDNKIYYNHFVGAMKNIIKGTTNYKLFKEILYPIFISAKNYYLSGYGDSEESYLLDNTFSSFNAEKNPISEKLVFVIVPFNEKFDYIWKREIKNIVESLGLTCVRAGDLYNTNIVMKDIFEAIYSAGIVIADVTGRNASVFYELGIAHALRKELILITQDEKDTPFDLAQFHHCIYKDDSLGYKILREHLTKSIKRILNM